MRSEADRSTPTDVHTTPADHHDRPTDDHTRWGGIALLVGVLLFLGSRFRHLVDPTDQLLGAIMLVAFTGWFLGLLALRAQYRQRSGELGRVGLVLCLTAIGMLTVGHVGAFLLGLPGPWFMPIVSGTFVLVIGVSLFGIGALRADVLPRWRAVPAFAGLVGFLWMVFAFDSRPVEGNPEAFLAMRTAFGLCWLPLAYTLLTDRRDATPSDRRSRAHDTEGTSP